MGYVNFDTEKKRGLFSHMTEASVQLHSLSKRSGFLTRQSEQRTWFTPLSALNLTAATHKEKPMVGCADVIKTQILRFTKSETMHSDPAKGKKYKISEKSNLFITFIVLHDLKEDILRIKIKQKLDFCDF